MGYNMKTLELFSGTKSFSKVAELLGHETFTVDNEVMLKPYLCESVFNLDISSLGSPDVIWASPPCQAFSVAAIGKNWHKGGSPKTVKAQEAVELVKTTMEIIHALKPKYWFVENPVGMLRKMDFMMKYPRKTVTYCQYGDNRMKPTDIWTNMTFWRSRPRCSPGARCHVSAPRGSRTGTQGLANARDRGVVPEELFVELFKQMEG